VLSEFAKKAMKVHQMSHCLSVETKTFFWWDKFVIYLLGRIHFGQVNESVSGRDDLIEIQLVLFLGFCVVFGCLHLGYVGFIFSLKVISVTLGFFDYIDFSLLVFLIILRLKVQLKFQDQFLLMISKVQFPLNGVFVLYRFSLSLSITFNNFELTIFNLFCL